MLVAAIRTRCNNRRIAERLGALKLAPGTGNLGDNLILCYEEMVRLELIPAKEMHLVQAWVSDLAELS